MSCISFIAFSYNFMSERSSLALSLCILSMSARPAATDIYSRKDSVNCCVACAFSPFAAVFAIAAAVDAVLAPASAVTAAAAVDALATTAAFATD